MLQGSSQESKMQFEQVKRTIFVLSTLRVEIMALDFFIKMTTPHDIIHNNLVFSASYLCTMAVNRYPRGYISKQCENGIFLHQ